MMITTLFSGFIAAVLMVLGTNPHVSTPQVENEPVVEGKVALQDEWFIYEIGSPSNASEATTPENYRRLEPTESIESLCSGNSTICAVKLPPQSSDTNLPDFSSSSADPAKQEIQNHFDEQNNDPVDEEVMRLKP